MKLETKPLKDAMSIAVRFLDKKNVIPVTGMVKLDFEKECLRVTTTNLDRTFTTEIKMFCPEQHSVLVDGNRFNAFFSQIGDETVDILIDDKSLTVKRKGGSAKFLLSKETYPTLPTVPDEDGVVFNGEVLSEAFNALLCGTDDDHSASQTWQTLAQIEVDNGFRCLASDMKRIVVCEGECTGKASLQIPINAIQVMRSLLDKDDVKIIQGQNHIFILTDHTFIFRRISATFPNIDTYLDATDFTDGFTVEAEELSHALGVVKSLVDSRLRSVTWTLDKDVTFSTRSAEVGDVSESLGITPEMQLVTGYNIDWLLAVVRQLSGEVICQFHIAGQNASLQIRRKRLTDTKFIIAPLTIR